MDHPLRVARKGKSLKQFQLADLCGIDPSLVSKIESGQDSTLGTFRALGRALGLDYRTLLPADPEHQERAQ